MTLHELVTIVSQKIGLEDAQTLAKLRSWARARHRMICDQELWRDLLQIYTFAVTAEQPIVTLGNQVDRIISARWDQQNLLPVDQMFIFAADPGLYDRTGSPMRFTVLPAVALATAPSAERLSIVSDSSADTSKQVTVVGELAGVEKRERVTLNGTTPVLTVNSYDIVYKLTKEATTGNLTITGYTSAAALGVIAAEESGRNYPRLRLLESPQQALTLAVLAKRRAPDLIEDSDPIAIRGIDQAIEAFLLADAQKVLLKQGDDANDTFNEAMALLGSARAVEVYQEASVVQLIPYDGAGADPIALGGKGYW